MLNTKNITDQEPLQKVPSLKTYCQNCVRRNISKVYELNEMPYHLLHDILANISPFHLKRIEDLNPYLIKETEPIWKKIALRSYKTLRESHPTAGKTFRQMYFQLESDKLEKQARISEKLKRKYPMPDKSEGRAKKMIIKTPPKSRPKSVFGSLPKRNESFFDKARRDVEKTSMIYNTKPGKVVFNGRPLHTPSLLSASKAGTAKTKTKVDSSVFEKLKK